MSARKGRVATHAVPVVLACVAALALTACSHSSQGAAPTTTADSTTTRSTNSATTSATTSTPARSTGVRRGSVDVFGDSLTVQAGDALRVEGRAHGLNVSVAAYYGLAPCDLLGPIRDDLAHPPGALVVAFSGNNITPCMAPGGHELTGSAYYDAYRRDVSAIVAAATARKVPVLVVAPPLLSTVKNVPDRVELSALYRQIVARYPGARFTTATTVITPAGFTATRPCVAGETAALGCRNGVITVRSPDQIHFDEPRTVPCPTGPDQCEYSAGAHRYADVMLAALSSIASLPYRSASPAVGVPIDMTQRG